jgi:cytidyltransferase-like protein
MSRCRVVVFGTFDPFHRGHQQFLEQAQRHGDELIVIVTRDSIIQSLKRRHAHHNEHIRLSTLHQHGFQAVLGDAVLGSYQVLQHYQPTVICYGHDQLELANDLRHRMTSGQILICQLIQAQPYHRDIYSSTLIRHANLANPVNPVNPVNSANPTDAAQSTHSADPADASNPSNKL